MKKFVVVVIAAACWISFAFAQQAKPGPLLKYAVIVTRHGVRSPTWTPQQLNMYSSLHWPDWGVPPGNLTGHGRALMKIMGGYYRDFFSAQGLLGDTGCSASNLAYFWADTDQRTLESARALSEGMFPGCKAVVHAVDEGKADPLFNPLEVGTVRMDAQMGLASVSVRIGPNLDTLIEANRPAFDLLSRLLNGDGKSASSLFAQSVSLKADPTGVTMEGPLSLAPTLTEDFLLEYTHGMQGDQLGWGRLTPSNLQQVMSLHTTYADLMRRTPYLARARGSILLNAVLRSLEQATEGKAVKGALGSPQSRLVVVSGHDTNLSNLSGLLNVSWLLHSYQPDDTPPGGALIFSLLQSPDNGRYSVRLQFVAQTMAQMHDGTPLSADKPPAVANVFIPGCSASTPDYACDWPSFTKVVQGAISPEFVTSVQ